MRRWLVIGGAMLLLLGLTYPVWAKIAHTLWHLPGNIIIKRDHFQLYFPLTLCLIVSLVLTVLSWLSRR